MFFSNGNFFKNLDLHFFADFSMYIYVFYYFKYAEHKRQNLELVLVFIQSKQACYNPYSAPIAEQIQFPINVFSHIELLQYYIYSIFSDKKVYTYFFWLFWIHTYIFPIYLIYLQWLSIFFGLCVTQIGSRNDVSRFPPVFFLEHFPESFFCMS